MDPTLAGIIMGAAAQSVQSSQDQSNRAAQNSANTSTAILAGIQAAAAQALLNSNVPSQVADLNTTSATPNPRIQVVPGYFATPQPVSPAVAAAA